MRRLFLVLSIATLAAPQLLAKADAKPYEEISVTRLPTDLDHPWGIAVIDERRALVTEKSGQLKIVDYHSGRTTAVTGVPEVFYKAQGGLLDVALDPNFAANNTIYLSYSEAAASSKLAGTAVGKGVLKGAKLTNFKRIWQQQPKVSGPLHFGSRLSFGPKGHLFITTGDRYHAKEQAQKLDNHLGKVIRILPDGSIPKDNPFVGVANALDDIWSYGHRNVQGADHHPQTGELWTGEHGAQGGDEINITKAGLNYGWPVITHGIDYDGSKIGEGRFKKGMQQPLYYWNPSIAPCGLIIYSGKMFTSWQHDVLVTSLKFAHLARLSVAPSGKVTEEKLLTDLKMRMRDIAEAPDGSLLIVFDQKNAPLVHVTKKGRPAAVKSKKK